MSSADARTERSFGRSIGTVALVLGGLLWWRGRVTGAVVLGALGLVLVVSALLCPRLLRWPCAVWWRLAHAIGWFNARVLLSLIYVLVFVPVGLVGRLVRWDPLRCRRDGRSSEWVPYPERIREAKHYERMF